MTEQFAVVWTDTALQDLLDIVEYLVDRDGLEAGERVHSTIAESVRGLTTMPHRCRNVGELEAEGITGYRELLVGPYRIMFAVHTDTVVVLTAVDGRRDFAELLLRRALREAE